MKNYYMYLLFVYMCFQYLTSMIDSRRVNFVEVSLRFRSTISELFPQLIESEINEGELAAFCAYAVAFPNGFLALIDTYDVIR